MRTYGRTQDVRTGVKTWWVITTNYYQSGPINGNPRNTIYEPLPGGFNDAVYLTALAQVIKLNLGESPFFGDWGIPAHESIITQTYPDIYMVRIQQRFAPYFASLILTPTPISQGSSDSYAVGLGGGPAPRYNINVLTNYGSSIGVSVSPDFPQEQPI